MGRCLPRNNPFFVAPPHAAPCWGWLSRKNTYFFVLHLVFLKLIFYHNHNKNHHQQNSAILVIIFTHKAFSGGSAVKNLPAMQGPQEMWLNPWIGKIPWRRKWQPTPVFLPGESYGQRSLVGYSPSVCKELDTIDRLT